DPALLRHERARGAVHARRHRRGARPAPGRGAASRRECVPEPVDGQRVCGRGPARGDREAQAGLEGPVVADGEERPDVVQIAETRQVYEAELIALKLREAGVDAEVLDHSFRQEPLPNVRSFSVVRVMVPAAQEAAAREALAEGQPLPEDGESDE